MKWQYQKLAVAGILCFFLSSPTTAQMTWEPEMGQNRIVPYEYVRTADVLWSKRVWRRIDLHEKMNHPLYYPLEPIDNRKSLFDVIKEGVIENASLVAYYPGILGDDDEFTTPMSIDEVKNLLISKDSVWTDGLDGEPVMVVVENNIKSENIKQYEIKEEWFFDNKYSVMKVRIVGICPYIEKCSESGEFLGYQPLFWIYFPNLRQELIRHDVFLRHNDKMLTYDALFSKRFFSSVIIKESNVYDRFINEYKFGLDALLEAENIKEKIFNYEHDVWEY